MNSEGCQFWDYYNQCCMWTRIEKIFQFAWEEDEGNGQTVTGNFENSISDEI